MTDNVYTLPSRESAQVLKHPSTLMVEDLAQSGLEAKDIGARPLEGAERAACRIGASIPGYVIPYYDIFGRPIAHYRCKLFNNPDDAKYKQPKDTQTYIYFPKTFLKAARYSEKHMEHHIIYITEGEKKAAIATKLGFPTIALGGVDAWRNRSITVPGDNLVTAGVGKVKAKLEPTDSIKEDDISHLAIGMQDVIDYAMATHATFVIVFDSDRLTGIRPQVQRAAATLAFELRYKGVQFHNLRQIILPFNEEFENASKVGLDDFLIGDHGYENFVSLVKQCVNRRSAFPRHPSIQDYVGKRLQKAKLSRKEQQAVAIALLSDLDATGMRLKSSEEKQTYYFDLTSKTLMRAAFVHRNVDEGHETPFGSLLYRRFGLSAADQRTLTWLSVQYNSESPIGEVSPERVIAKTRQQAAPDTIRYQINDGQYVQVNADGIEILDNGRHNVLFEGGHVEPIDAKELINEFKIQSRKFPTQNWWDNVLSKVRLQDHDHTQKLHALLYYISPWLYRWRGTQLPVELVLGESGSGKSTLSELRLSIITGKPRLRGTPQDIRDWHASIVNVGAFHVTDNVQLADYNLRQKLSDELCRLVTEPDPYIEARKLYTNADVVRFPVRAVFSITAISQPFQNADILQRSVILELEKVSETADAMEYEGAWVSERLAERGGRTAWLAHHLVVLQRFLRLAQKEWNPHYKAKHRLINLEQCLTLMAKVFNQDTSWLPNYLMGITDTQIAHADWAFEGMTRFIADWKDAHPRWAHNSTTPSYYITVADISEWAQSDREFKQCDVLVNSRRLGRWLQQNQGMIARILGVMRAGVFANRQRYRVVKLQKQTQSSGTE